MAARHLFAASVLFLALPYAIFLVGWLQPVWAAGAILLLIAAGVGTVRAVWQVGGAPACPDVPLSRATALLYGGLALGLAYISGAGGYGFQTHDWIKHEALLGDLIARPWPVAYTYYTQPVALVYYFAHYLPAAAVGKAAGLAAAHAVLFGWTAVGILLTLGWFGLLARRATLTTALVLLLFGGLDGLGLLVRHGLGWTVAQAANWREIEDWTDLLLQFDAPVNSLFWAPQHALSGWLAGAMLAYLLLVPLPKLELVPLALTPFWSPFVTVGLLPLVGIRWLRDRTPWRQRLADRLSLPNLASVGLLLLAAFYFAAKVGPISPLLVSRLPHGWLPATVAMDGPRRLAEWGLFMLVEVGLWVGVLAWGRRAQDVRGLWGSVGAGLVLVSIYSIGLNNDLGMRAAIPLIFLLAAMAERTLADPAARWQQYALVGLLVVGASTPLTEYVRQIGPLVGTNLPWRTADYPPGSGIDDLFRDDAVRFSQYVGNATAPFFTWAARPLTLPADAPGPDYISYGDKILLASYRVQPAGPAMPGSTVEVVLELHVFTQVIDRNYGLQIRLVDAAGQTVWQEQGWPQNRPTAEPTEEIVWFDTRRIALPPDLVPGIYRLDLGVVDPDAGQADGGDLVLATYLPGGAPLGDLPPIGYVEVGDRLNPAVTPFDPAPRLGDALALAGSAVEKGAAVAPGDTVTVTLRWTAQARPPEGLTGFVHLLDAGGALVAQWDRPLAGGFLPGRIWQPGLRVEDVYPLAIPPDAAPGEYTWVAGLYDAATGQRLPVQVGSDPAQDAFAGGSIRVVR